MIVSHILTQKGNVVFTISPESNVFEALQLMADKNIGALVVQEEGRLKGIFSERDYARKIVLLNRNSTDTLVQEIMTTNVITVTPNETVDNCMALMSDKKFRHLPVVDGGEIVGLISISDIVRAIIERQKETIDHLQSYIAG